MSASSLYILLNLAWLKSLGLNGFRLFLAPSRWFLGLGLFQNIFYNLLMYTNNFCFGYITVSCFFETFPGGWLAGGGWLEKPILMKTQSSVWTWTWTLDFDLGFVNFLIYNGGVRYMFLSISRAQKSIQDWN